MRYEYRQLNDRDGSVYAEITGCDGALRFSAIPDELNGLPVRALGDHAFSGRKDLEEIRIPAGVRKLGRFCFYDCPSLRRIALTDVTDDIGDGAIRECSSLRWIEVTVSHGSYRAVKDLADDSKAELHFRIFTPAECCLVFPAWHSEDREDTHARAIHPGIGGAGYAYRQTVTRTEMLFRDYDALFEKAAADGVQTAAEVALWRLARPVSLSAEAERIYVDYLTQHAGGVLLHLTENGGTEDRELLRVLLDSAKPDSCAVSEAIDAASAAEQTEICSMLMEYDRRNKAEGDAGPEIFVL